MATSAILRYNMNKITCYLYHARVAQCSASSGFNSVATLSSLCRRNIVYNFRVSKEFDSDIRRTVFLPISQFYLADYLRSKKIKKHILLQFF